MQVYLCVRVVVCECKCLSVIMCVIMNVFVYVCMYVRVVVCECKWVFECVSA